jgi:hypothetical protein
MESGLVSVVMYGTLSSEMCETLRVWIVGLEPAARQVVLCDP